MDSIWVDLAASNWLKTCIQKRPRHLLSLRRIRAFDDRLWRQGATELPTLLLPENAVFEDGFEYKIVGLNVQQKGNFVFQADLTFNFIVGDEDDEMDGSDFDEDAIPVYDDTSDRGYSTDEEDSSTDGEDSTYDMEEWEADHELGVAYFLSILEA